MHAHTKCHNKKTSDTSGNLARAFWLDDTPRDRSNSSCDFPADGQGRGERNVGPQD